MSSNGPTSALELGRAYLAGRTDPLTVVRAALEQAERVPHAFISVDRERALERAAAAADRWSQRKPLSPLDGVPIGWKDLIDVAGSVTTAGSALFRSQAPAARNAPIVDAALRCGMIGIGKTNLSEFAYSGLGLNPHFGTPTNPKLDHGSRVPGGSSSGSAIAVATGIVPLSVGTDTAGSIRVPSAFNGLTGFRASTTRYSREGVTALSPTLDTIGPLANTVADCVAFDAAIRGAAPVAACSSLPLQRFVVDPSLLDRYGVTDSVSVNLQRFVERLADAGAVIETRPLASLAQVHELNATQGWIGALEAFERYRALLDSGAASQIDQRVRTRLEMSRSVPTERLDELRKRRQTMIADFAHELAGATLIAPTVAHVAPLLAPLAHDAALFANVNLKTLALTMLGSFLDAPAIALPSGADELGLPTGVQLMRAAYDDDALLAVAQTIEQKFS
jgi:aspartyl-tRNA(Asn)/glutamyl-tRNA(Gln) amidotransferase subunit A